MDSARNHHRSSNGNGNGNGGRSKAVEEILQKWKDINSSSSRAPLRARGGCKKGCMRGKGGPENLDCKFRGVRQRVSGKWVAEIREPNGGKLLWLGTFPTAIQAALAYDEASKAMYGLPERLNFPPHSAASTPPEESTMTTTSSSNSNCSHEFFRRGTDTSQMEEYLSPKVAAFLPFHKETLVSLVYDGASIAMYGSSALLYLPPQSVADSSGAASTPPESTMTTSFSNSNCSDEFVRGGTNTRQMEEKAHEYLSPKVAPFLPPLMEHSISTEGQAVNTPGFKGTYEEKQAVLEAESADDNNNKFECAPNQDDLLLHGDDMFDVDEFLRDLETTPIFDQYQQLCEQEGLYELQIPNPYHPGSFNDMQNEQPNTEFGFNFLSDDSAWQDQLAFLH